VPNSSNAGDFSILKVTYLIICIISIDTPGPGRDLPGRAGSQTLEPGGIGIRLGVFYPYRNRRRRCGETSWKAPGGFGSGALTFEVGPKVIIDSFQLIKVE
jgi:hypothetical protein